MANNNNNESTLYSIATYTGDGTTKEFIVPFPYLYVDDVHLYVDGEEIDIYPVISEDTPPSPYIAHWYATNIIRFNDAPTTGKIIRIQRITNRETPEVDFTNSTILNEDDLNLIATQLLYIVQETYDSFGETYNTITSLLNEAINVSNTVRGYKEDASGYADAASGYADAASGYANDASGYANDASGYANDASGYADAASGYANDASGYASQAQNITNNSKIIATGATASRSLANRFSDVINVLDFGANGNGTTMTNTPILNAIQASVDATGTITDVDGNAMLRTPIFFPRGTYKISAASIMTYFQSFIGNGAKILYNNKEYWIGEAVRGTLYVGNDDKIPSTVSGYRPYVPAEGLVNIANGQLKFWPDLNGDGAYDADIYATSNLYLAGESSVQLLHKGNGRARVAVQDQANWVTVESNTDFPDEDRPAYTQKKGIVYLQPGVQNNNTPVYWYDDSDPDNIKVPTNYTDLAITRYRDTALCAYFDMKSLRVGVGTSSPICALDVFGTSKMQNKMRIGSSGASAAYLIFDSTVEGTQHQTRPKIGAEGDEVQILSKARVALRLRGDVSGSDNGEVVPGYTGKYYLGSGTWRWDTVYAVNGSIDTSDERQKDNIADPDEALMRAWGKVNFKVFQFKDAIEKKGENARIHCGVIAQQVMEAFASEGLDASRYGLFCHDSWEAKPAKVDPDTGEVTDEAIEAGDSYGIRYSEALALECAYQRWRLDKIESSINNI